MKEVKHDDLVKDVHCICIMDEYPSQYSEHFTGRKFVLEGVINDDATLVPTYTFNIDDSPEKDLVNLTLSEINGHNKVGGSAIILVPENFITDEDMFTYKLSGNFEHIL